MNIHSPPGEKHLEMHLTNLDGGSRLIELVRTIQCNIDVVEVTHRAVVVSGRGEVCGGTSHQANIMSRPSRFVTYGQGRHSDRVVNSLVPKDAGGRQIT